MLLFHWIIIPSLLFSVFPFSSPEPELFLHEEFYDLTSWTALPFSGKKNPTEFRLVKIDTLSCLRIESRNSASGLILTQKFNPEKYSHLSWRWRVDAIIASADGRRKEEDDYPIRLFVLFDDDSADVSFWESIRNTTLKLFYVTELPETSLCFVWPNRRYAENHFNSPYADGLKIIPIQKNHTELSRWISYDVKIDSVFRSIFGRRCPQMATLAIMADTDNTNNNTVAYLDYIMVEGDD